MRNRKRWHRVVSHCGKMLEDPLTLLSASLWLFAAGMYPVGLMLGASCSPCCECPCEGSEVLPQYLTVTLSSLPEEYHCCATFWNGTAIRVERVPQTSCVFSGACCSYPVTVTYRGQTTPPTVVLGGRCGDLVFEAAAEAAPFLCASLNFTATEPLGGMAVVSTEYDDPPPPCPGCCYGLSEEFNDTTCNQEDCESAGGRWFTICDCNPCSPGSCEGLSVIVEASATCTYVPNTNPATNTMTRSHTFTLDAANGFYEFVPLYAGGSIYGGYAQLSASVDSPCAVEAGWLMYPNATDPINFGISICPVGTSVVMPTDSFGCPIVGGSATASELTSGALQPFDKTASATVTIVT